MARLGAILAVALAARPGSAEEVSSVTNAPLAELEFFSMLDYSLPYLGDVKAAVDAGDFVAAKAALLAAMRGRRTPVTTVDWESWLGPPSLNWWDRPAAVDPSFDRTVVDKICRHVFAGGVISSYPDYEMGPRIDWAANPSETREWTYSFNRHPNWVFLGQAYWATGDEKYAREFNDEVIDWVTNCPLVTDGTHQSSASWRTIEAGIRMLYSWPVAYQYFLQSPSLTPEANYLMMRSLVDHAQHLARYPTGGNWITMEADGLVYVGTLHPEFKDAGQWRETGMERLSREITKQIGADGLQVELATDYHIVVVCCFSGAMEVQTANGIPVPDEYRESLEKLYEAVMYITKPSGWVPGLNDALARVEGYDLPEALEPTVSTRQVLARGAALFGRDDMTYVATGGRQGTPPVETSHAFPYAGYYVMRSGWDPDARYLVFDAGPFGAGHQHEDKLSVEAYAYGRTLLFDTGTGPYAGSPFRSYFVSTEGHNTVLVDGQAQNRRAQIHTEEQSRWVSDEPSPSEWISRPVFDYGCGTYDEGYGPGRDRSVTHRRQVLFVKPDYWVVLDDFLGSGSHGLTTLWHLRPGGFAVTPGDQACATTNPGEANLLVLPASAEGLTVDVLEGRTDPVAGWISLTCGDTKVPAPEADYTWHGDLPASLGWLLYPSADAVGSHPRIAFVPVHGEPGAKALRVTSPDGSVDYLLFAPGCPGRKGFAGLETDAEVAAVRLDAYRRVVAHGSAGGTFLELPAAPGA